MLKAQLLVASLLLVTSWYHALCSQSAHAQVPALDASPSSGVQDRRLLHRRVPRSQDSNCNVKDIIVTVDESRVPGHYNYTVIADNPEKCRSRIYLYGVGDNNILYYDQAFRFKTADNRCWWKKGTYRLKIENVESNNFSLSGFDVLLDELIFLNDSVAQMKFKKSSWLSQLQLRVKDKHGKVVGAVTVNDTPAIIPGSYILQESYYVWVLPQGIECSDIDHQLSTKQVYSKPIKPDTDTDNNNNNAVILISLLGGACFCIGIVAVATFIRYARKADQPAAALHCYSNRKTGCRTYSVSSDTPLIPAPLGTVKHQSGDVLLVHAADSQELIDFCQNLKDDITKYCNRRQVLDITVSSVERIECPESWMLQVLSRKHTTVLLVLSPALAALHNSLQPNGERNGVAVQGRMQVWDNLLRDCLSYLEEHLQHNYAHLFIVAKSQESLKKDDIRTLVPETRFLFPDHRHKLLTALGSCHV